MKFSKETSYSVKNWVNKIISAEVKRYNIEYIRGKEVDLTSNSNMQILEICHKLANLDLIVFHGSNVSKSHTTLEPHQSNDAAKRSGNQTAVYATVEVDVALAHAVFNKSYVLSKLSSFTFGYAITHTRRLFRATKNLYQLFLEHDPNLCTDGYVYILDKCRFLQAPDTVTEYHSREHEMPLAILKIPKEISTVLFVVGEITGKDTVVQYSLDELHFIDAHTAKLQSNQ